MIVKIVSERDNGNGESSFKIDFKYEQKDFDRLAPATGCLGEVRGMPYHMNVPHKCNLSNKTKSQFGQDGFLKTKK